MRTLSRREFLCGAVILTNPRQPFLMEAPYYVSSYVVARGNTHVHTIASNDAASRRVIEAYLRDRRKLVKVDPDHLFADDLDTTLLRAKQLGLNFIMIQDHGEKLSDAHYLRSRSYDGRLLSQLSWSNASTDIGGEFHSGFCGYAGFEWTQGGLFSPRPPGKARQGKINHVGVFGAPELTGTTLRADATGILSPDFPSLCEWLTRQKPGAVIASFNHPGYGNDQFGGFDLPAELEQAKAYINMMELGSGADAFYEGIGENEKHYVRALQHGWRLMPTIGIDNWGKLTQAARDRHVAVWSLIRLWDNSNFFTSVSQCQGYASEIRDLLVVFGLTGVHVDQTMPYESGKALMGQIATPCILGESLRAIWHLSTKNPTRFRELGMVTVLPQSTDFIELESHQGAVDLPFDRSAICYYLKGTAADGRRFITAPVFIIHRNIEHVTQAQTEPFGTLRAKLTGFRLEDNTSLPVLLNWVPPALELTWERAHPDWLIEVIWEVPSDRPSYQTLDYSDLDKRRALMFDRHYHKKEVPLERFGDYRITISVGERIRRSSTKLVFSLPFQVTNQPLRYIPDRLRIFRSL